MWYFGDQIFPVVWPLSLLASSSGFQDELTASDNKVPTEPGATAILQELSAGGLRDTAMLMVSMMRRYSMILQSQQVKIRQVSLIR